MCGRCHSQSCQINCFLNINYSRLIPPYVGVVGSIIARSVNETISSSGFVIIPTWFDFIKIRTFSLVFVSNLFEFYFLSVLLYEHLSVTRQEEQGYWCVIINVWFCEKQKEEKSLCSLISAWKRTMNKRDWDNKVYCCCYETSLLLSSTNVYLCYKSV